MVPRLDRLDSFDDESLIYDDGLVRVYVMIDYAEDMEIELKAKQGYNPITVYEAVRDNGNFITLS